MTQPHWLGARRSANDDRIAEGLLQRLPYPAFESAEVHATHAVREAYDSAFDDDGDTASIEEGLRIIGEWACAMAVIGILGLIAWGFS